MFWIFRGQWFYAGQWNYGTCDSIKISSDLCEESVVSDVELDDDDDDDEEYSGGSDSDDSIEVTFVKRQNHTILWILIIVIFIKKIHKHFI